MFFKFFFKEILHLQHLNFLFVTASLTSFSTFLCTFFPYCPIHSDAGPDWVLFSLYQCAKEKRLQYIAGTPQEIESVYTKWSYSRCVQVERDCYFFSPSHISWLVRFINVGVNIQWQLALNIAARSPAAAMLHPAPSTRFLLQLRRYFICSKPLLNPYDSVCYCLYKCPILF